MLGNAKLSPRSRGISDLDVRVARLERYEAWAKCQPLKIQEQINPDLWERYYKVQEEILAKMREAQVLALEISQSIKQGTTS